MTVHSAKGTEAKVCYLIRVEPGFIPMFVVWEIAMKRRRIDACCMWR